MSKWEKITGIIARIFGYIGGAAVAVMTINILLDASMRSLFTSPIPGTLEYVQYWWMILVAFGGWALAGYKGEHIDAPIIGDRLHPRYQLIWRVVALAVTLVYLALIIYYGWNAAMHAMQIGEYQGGYSTPIWFFRFFIPLAAGAFAFVAVHQLWISIVELRRFREPHPEETASEIESVRSEV